jgi:glycosyltransferase involved in cell wall biosynthesis
MTIGILIIFRNDEDTIDVQKFTELFAEKKKVTICLVNNGSTDATLTVLKEIQEEATIPISIIDIKKNRGYNAAMKAGVRYLTSTKDLPYILCLQKFTSKDITTLDKVFRIIQQEKNVVTDLFSKSKRLAHKNVFSLQGILETAC